MKRQWRLRREMIPTEDGQRRWDLAYQHLLRWVTTLEQGAVSCPATSAEVYDESCSLREGLDPAADTNADH
jgi:hypothetical protein